MVRHDPKDKGDSPSATVVIAPHGGTIEPLTDNIARAIAGEEFSYYCFRALKPRSRLHIKSHLFDEPTCERLVAAHKYVISIHGWGEEGQRICVGGRDSELITVLKERLNALGMEVEAAERYLAATDPQNITNRGLRRQGVQFELTMALRKNAKVLEQFVETVRAVLLEVQSGSTLGSRK